MTPVRNVLPAERGKCVASHNPPTAVHRVPKHVPARLTRQPLQHAAPVAPVQSVRVPHTRRILAEAAATEVLTMETEGIPQVTLSSWSAGNTQTRGSLGQSQQFTVLAWAPLVYAAVVQAGQPACSNSSAVLAVRQIVESLHIHAAFEICTCYRTGPASLCPLPLVLAAHPAP